MTEIEMNSTENTENTQLQKFIKIVKVKFGKMESKLEKTNGELIYFKRKSQEQRDELEELRKRER